MKNLTLLFSFFFLPIFGIAQVSFVLDSLPPDIQQIKITPDGGWISKGLTNVTKFNPCGGVEWSNDYFIDSLTAWSFSNIDFDITPAGEILISGFYSQPSASTFNSLYGSFLLKIDALGNPLWCNLYTLNESPSINNNPWLELDNLEINTSGDYLLSGNGSLSNITNHYTLKVDADGFPIWNKKYFSTNDQVHPFSKVSSDGGLLISSSTNEISNWQQQNDQFIIYKINAFGEMVWSDTISIYLTDIIEVSDGFVGVSGNQILKLNTEGELIWERNFDDNANQSSFTNISMLSNGNFLTYSRPYPNINQEIKTIWSPQGEIIKQMTNTSFSLNGSLRNTFDVFPDNSLLVTYFSKISRTDSLQFLSCVDSLITPSLITSELNINSIPTKISEDIPIFTKALDIQVVPIDVDPELSCEEYYIQDTQIDTLLCPDQTIELDVNFFGAESFLWQDGSTSSQIEITSPGVYSVEILNCENIVIKTFNVMNKNCNCATTPNVFTPDGDGMNDSFAPIYNCDVQNLTFQIFNRWGELVFTTNSLEEKWDGMYRDKPAISDVYVYKLIYEDEVGEMQSQNGDVTLIR